MSSTFNMIFSSHISYAQSYLGHYTAGCVKSFAGHWRAMCSGLLMSGLAEKPPCKHLKFRQTYIPKTGLKDVPADP